MKLSNVSLVGLALLLVLGLGTAQATTVSLTYDGYCDGVTFVTGGSPPVLGSQCGCVSGTLYGTIGKQGSDQAAHISHDVTADYAGIHALIRANHTWELWNSFGLINSGTWSNGCPVDVVNKPSAANGR